MLNLFFHSCLETVKQFYSILITLDWTRFMFSHLLFFLPSAWNQSDVWSPSSLLERATPPHGRFWRPAQKRAVRSPDWPHASSPLPAGRCSYLLLHGPGDDSLTKIVIFLEEKGRLRQIICSERRCPRQRLFRLKNTSCKITLVLDNFKLLKLMCQLVQC